MDGVKDEKDILIDILTEQRNSFLNAFTSAQWQIAKMQPFMPKEPNDVDKREQQLQQHSGPADNIGTE